jgi:uncharacterized membrane protein
MRKLLLILFSFFSFSFISLSQDQNSILAFEQDSVEMYSSKIGENILKQIPSITVGIGTVSEQKQIGAYQLILNKRQDSIFSLVSNKALRLNGVTHPIKDYHHLILKEPQGQMDIAFIDLDTEQEIGTHHLKLYPKPIFSNDVIVFGLLFLALALVFFTSSSKKKGFKIFYKIFPALLMCYLIPAILTSTGVISSNYSHLYTMAKTYLLPCALILMTLSIDVKGLLNLGPKAIIMFLTATVGIILGGPIAVWIFSFIDPETVMSYPDVVDGAMNPEAYASTWRGLSTLAGSWIGGGANQTAMYEMYAYEEGLYGAMITVDIVVANIWMAILLVGVAKNDKINKFFKADNSSIDKLVVTMEDYEKQVQRKATLKDYMILLGLAFGAVAFAHFASDWLSEAFEFLKDNEYLSSLTSKFFWMILISTVIGFIYSFTKVRTYEGVGASKIGSIFIYILVATIGMKMDVTKIFDKPLLIVVGLVWMLIHVIILVVVGRLIKAPFFFLAVGSKANIGGAASAPVVAGAFHPSLASVGAILAVFGYFLGTIGAMVAAMLMKYVSPCVDCLPQ